MNIRKIAARIIAALFQLPGPVVRYLLPSLTLAVAVGIQALIAQFVPKHTDFPYVFFFMIAIFVTAWFGGYVPGAMACLITMIGIPLAVNPNFRLTSVDPSRLVLLIGVSAAISWVAQSQRKQRELLREANDELEKRVQYRTQELAAAVEAKGQSWPSSVGAYG